MPCNLALSGFSIGVALVARSLSRCLVLYDAGNARLFGVLACLCIRLRGSLRGRLQRGCLGGGACLLLQLHLFALKASFLARRGNRCAFGLARRPGRLGGDLRRTIGVEESLLRIGGSRAAVGKLIVSGILQVVVLIVLVLEWSCRHRGSADERLNVVLAVLGKACVQAVRRLPSGMDKEARHFDRCLREPRLDMPGATPLCSVSRPISVMRTRRMRGVSIIKGQANCPAFLD